MAIKKTTKKAAKKRLNKISLREAVNKVLGKKSIGKDGIMDGVIAVGYVFSGKNPMNNLKALIYKKGEYNNKDGKFSVIKK